MKGNYCIYLRKSRADAEAEARGEGETLARHQAMLLGLAKKMNLNIIKIYKEIVSGDSIASRPQMQAMLTDITDGKYDGVLVAEVERLARGDTIDQGVVAQTFKQSDTKIITPVKTYDPQNEYDEEYFEFSLFMSRREYKTINRRMQAGRLASIKEGNYICSSDPYGYRKINPEPKVHTLEIVPEEAEVIRLIYKLYLEGHGGKYIANELNRMGLKPQRKELWETVSVKKILSNPLYCGYLKWHTKSNGDTLYKGLHEPIIEKEVFDTVQEKKKSNPASQTPSDQKLLNYYHGMLFCANCGHQMRRRYIANTGKAHLLCESHECRGKVVSAPLPTVDEAVISAFIFRVNELTSGLSSNEVEQKKLPKPDKRKPIIAELDKLKKQQLRLYDFLEQEIYDTNTFLERSKIISDKIDALKLSLAELDESQEPPQLPPEEAISRLTYVIDNFSSAGSEEKQRMLKSVARRIYYKKTTRMCRRNLESDLSVDVVFL